MTFNPNLFAAQKGTLSEKLATVFETAGIRNGTAETKGAQFGFGTILSAKTITPVGVTVPFQMYLKFDGDYADATQGCAYFKSENITVDQPLQQIANVMSRVTLNFNIFDAYGIQSHLTIADDMETTDANAHLTAISGKLVLTDAKTVAKGWATAGLFIVEGAGSVTQICHGVSIVAEAGATGCQSLLQLYSDVADMCAFTFTGTSATESMIYEATDTHQTFVGSIKINVNGTDRYLHYADDHAATS
jgi:hypothetical protein